MGEYRIESEEKEEPQDSFSMEKGVTPFYGPRRMENGEWESPLPSTCGKHLCSIHMLGFKVCFVIHHAFFVVWIFYENFYGKLASCMCEPIKKGTMHHLIL